MGSHATYNIGPGQAYTTLTSFPWLNLVAGDVVNVYYSPTPYATIIALRASGTASAPVVINGVADPSTGNLPTITGSGAVTSADAIAQGFFTSSGGPYIEGGGVIILYRGLNDNYYYKPSYVTIQNLRVTGAAPGNTYMDHTGTKQTYAQFVAGIYAVATDFLTLQNDELFGNGLGAFVNDSSDASHTSYFTTLRGNYIHDNGVVGSDTEHNVYVQGVRTLYEGNYFGDLIAGAQGGSLKDRSSGPVVRFNYITSAARAIDLVDSEGGSTLTNSDPLYNYGWVYGNVIVNNFSNAGPSSGDLIHWGGDSQEYSLYHEGPLYFYNNTIYSYATANQANSVGSIAMFDMATNQQQVIATNNVIVMAGGAPLYLCTNSASNGTQGTLTEVGTNWLAAGSTGQCTLQANGTLLAGTPTVLNATNYHLPVSSPAIGAGVAYPPTSLTTLPSPTSIANLQAVAQFATGSSAASQGTIVNRTTATDLGAFSYP